MAVTHKSAPKNPLLILINLDNKKHIKALSFFDVSRKDIIPLGDFVNLHQSFYCGSAFGWVFVSRITNYRVTGGRGNWQRLKITLINPFTGRVVRLPLLDRAPGGQVLLLESAPHVNAIPSVVLYYMVENGRVSNEVNCLKIADKTWTTFDFSHSERQFRFGPKDRGFYSIEQRPSDLIVFDGNFYAIEQDGVISQFHPFDTYHRHPCYSFDVMTRNLQSTIPKEPLYCLRITYTTHILCF